MFNQTFQTSDLAGVGALVVLEALLSADNALVLAIMVRHLPKDQRQKALLYGLGGAFVFRFIAILFASVVLQQWWLQAIGSAYLLFLPIKHFIKAHRESGGKEVKPVGGGFWPTVIAVEMTDIAFAVDSVLAGVTFIDNKQEKIWVVYLGALIGIVLLRFAAGMFIRLLEKYPVLDHVAYVLVGWVGVKLAFLAGHTYDHYHPGVLQFSIPEMPVAVFWGVLLAIAFGGAWLAYLKRTPSNVSLEGDASEMEDAQDMHIDRNQEEKAP